MYYCLFFFNDTATTEIYTLSLHDALPILVSMGATLAFPLVARDLLSASLMWGLAGVGFAGAYMPGLKALTDRLRSEEHTSELQSRQYLVCRLLLEKKKQE